MRERAWEKAKKKKKVSTTLKVSLWFNNRHTSGSYRGLNQSEIVKGRHPSDWPGPDIPVRQTEREVSRGTRSVANSATLLLDLAHFQTPRATSDKSSDFLDKF